VRNGHSLSLGTARKGMETDEDGNQKRSNLYYREGVTRDSRASPELETTKKKEWEGSEETIDSS